MKKIHAHARTLVILGILLVPLLLLWFFCGPTTAPKAARQSVLRALREAESGRLLLIQPKSETTRLTSLNETSAILARHLDKEGIAEIERIFERTWSFDGHLGSAFCYEPHHAIELISRDDSKFYIFICFDCAKIQPQDSDYVDCPPMWQKPLQKLFLREGFPLNTSLVHTAKVEPDGTIEELNGPFDFDADQPFKIDFGRGSGMHGLNTISIDESGTATICRRRIGAWARDGLWERATLTLTPEQRREVVHAVAACDLPNLKRGYLAKIYDGTQWALWIRQGEQQKTTYFDNRFPSEIQAFAKRLDEILVSAGSETLDWEQTNENPYEQSLWRALR